MDNILVSNYVKKQLNHLLPDCYIINDLEKNIEEVIKSLAFENIKIWNENPVLDILNSMQYPIFLYKLSRILNTKGDIKGATKIFYLNKILHSIDLFYEIDLKNNFLLGHVIGSVFCKAHYGEYSVFGQNILIGIDKNKRPQLNDGLVMFPNSAIIGDCKIGKNVVISTNVTILNENTPDNVYVFKGENGKLMFKGLNEYYADRYFIRNLK